MGYAARLGCWGDLGGRGKNMMHILDLCPQQVDRHPAPSGSPPSASSKKGSVTGSRFGASSIRRMSVWAR
jgi:hypothetical protein